MTLAYKANDLLTLLRIEVEWVRGDATRVAGMDEDRLARCNAMLAAQVKQLTRNWTRPCRPGAAAVGGEAGED